MFRHRKLPAGLTLITRQACSLCDEALEAIHRAGVDGPVTLRDVDEDSELSMYGERVPVLIDASGNVVAEGRITERVLRSSSRSIR
jgi:Glutaredoxin-like domain (DUF836)